MITDIIIITKIKSSHRNDTLIWMILDNQIVNPQFLLLMSFLSQDRAVYTCDEGCLFVFIVNCYKNYYWNHFIFPHRLPDCWGGKSGLPDIRPGPAHYHKVIRWSWFWRLNYRRQYLNSKYHPFLKVGPTFSGVENSQRASTVVAEPIPPTTVEGPQQ